MNELTVEQKGKMIGEIIESLRRTAIQLKKPFCEGTTFFDLAFMSDVNLTKIHKLSVR
jgi:hypothetical protein